jgi:hypothetical protein
MLIPIDRSASIGTSVLCTRASYPDWWEIAILSNGLGAASEGLE